MQRKAPTLTPESASIKPKNKIAGFIIALVGVCITPGSLRSAGCPCGAYALCKSETGASVSTCDARRHEVADL
jgi:hypothetical protein